MRANYFVFVRLDTPLVEFESSAAIFSLTAAISQENFRDNYLVRVL